MQYNIYIYIYYNEGDLLPIDFKYVIKLIIVEYLAAEDH